ncbi:MAG: nicotinate-nucleotide adenylyltransferase [Chloroflexi bacterium]|nr:nicotinate-nucleotide adenylyltransferase [Chloroflexota bacterium]
MKLGVLGGTFDPVHNGHLIIAEDVKRSLGLDSILFVPAGQPWLRAYKPVASAKDRLEMVRLATAGKPYFDVSSVEIERPGPSYMQETIADLKRKRKAGTEIYLILGWDSIATLTKWKEPQKLVEMCHLVAVHRPGYALPDLLAMEETVPGISRRVIVMEKPEIDISASSIREKIGKGLPVDTLVPKSVADYIREHRLYRQGGKIWIKKK